MARLRLELPRFGSSGRQLLFALALAAALEAMAWAGRRQGWRNRFLAAPALVRWGLYYAGAALLLTYGNVASQQFIYAHF